MQLTHGDNQATYPYYPCLAPAYLSRSIRSRNSRAFLAYPVYIFSPLFVLKKSDEIVANFIISSETKFDLKLTSIELTFYRRRVLGITKEIEDIGGLQWSLFVCLVIGWLVVYSVIRKGLHQSGKVRNNVAVSFLISIPQIFPWIGTNQISWILRYASWRNFHPENRLINIKYFFNTILYNIYEISTSNSTKIIFVFVNLFYIFIYLTSEWIAPPS